MATVSRIQWKPARLTVTGTSVTVSSTETGGNSHFLIMGGSFTITGTPKTIFFGKNLMQPHWSNLTVGTAALASLEAFLADPAADFDTNMLPAAGLTMSVQDLTGYSGSAMPPHVDVVLICFN